MCLAGLGSLALTKVERAYYLMCARSITVDHSCGFGGRNLHLRVIIVIAMASQKFMLAEFAGDQRYRVSSMEDVLTPALLLYPEVIAANVDRADAGFAVNRDVDLLAKDLDLLHGRGALPAGAAVGHSSNSPRSLRRP